MSLFWCVEAAKKYSFTVKADRGHPPLSFGIPESADKTAFIICVGCSVLLVFAVCCFSEIVPPIMTRIAVFVIAFWFWPFSGHPTPRQPMRFILFPIDVYVDATPSLTERTRDSTRETRIPTSGSVCVIETKKPCQQPRFGVIMKNLAKFFGCDKVAISHSGISGSLCQRLVSVCRAGGPRLVRCEA
jgi:hypothetical protein